MLRKRASINAGAPAGKMEWMTSASLLLPIMAQDLQPRGSLFVTGRMVIRVWSGADQPHDWAEERYANHQRRLAVNWQGG